MSDVGGEIPDELKNFIRRNVSSASLLEVLFLLKKDSQRKWTPQEVSLEMRSNPSYAALQLSELIGLKLVSAEETEFFWYAPQIPNPEIIDQLEELYNSRRPSVINYIYSQPIDSIREFANAFKIKKD